MDLSSAEYHPVLRDVCYVQSTVDQETKAVNSILIKRGKEWHAPDRMMRRVEGAVAAAAQTNTTVLFP